MTEPPARQVLSLDRGWRFHLGDPTAPLANTHLAAYMNNKAGWARGPARGPYDDSDWRAVDLPHDWSVEGAFSPDHHVSNGFRPRGVAWYRRHFRLDDADRGRRVLVRFDGVATHCTVFCNGHRLHRNFCGYTPFTVDVTDVATFGDEQNVLAVLVDATYPEGWWYEGAGIYRHAWLTKAAPLHVETDGVFVKPVHRGAGVWDVSAWVTVRNASRETVTFDVATDVIDPDGGVIVRSTTNEQLDPGRTKPLYDSFPQVRDPRLWSPERPDLYRLHTRLVVDDEVVDEVSTTFGFRTVRFDADRGFFLNDQPVKLKGTCNHQDHAGVGVAVPDSVHDFRVRRLLDMGCNAYRAAHHPPAPELLDACDRLGMLVIDENRNFGSAPEPMEQLRAMVRRDRNHPCVIAWSLCNEEAIQGTPVAASIARTMADAVRELDDSRPVTAAVSGGLLNDDNLALALDVVGINYQLPIYDVFRAKHPRLPVYAGETHCVTATRGEYATDAARHTFSGDDTERAPWGATARETWRALGRRDDVAGLFVWTGFDYRGEPSPHAWPCVNSFFGHMDTCGFAKDGFHLQRAYWSPDPFVHLLPHWTWPGREGEAVRVVAYTNADEVELRLNGEPVGRRAVDPVEMAEWSVPYRAGELRAMAYRGGAVVAEASVWTTGPAVALGLEVHPTVAHLPLPADGQHAVPVTVFAVDDAGRRVPTAGDFCTFTVDGPARVRGVGNGDPTCREPDKATSRSLFNGLAQVIVATTDDAGDVALTASAAGLAAATLRLRTTPTTPRPRVPVAAPRYVVGDWRMSPVTPAPPDATANTADSDMNSWERVAPAADGQPAWRTAGGFALYSATVKPPKRLQSLGGVVRFTSIAGAAAVFLNGQRVAEKHDASPAPLDVHLPPGTRAGPIAVLLQASAARAGLLGPVELLDRGAVE